MNVIISLKQPYIHTKVPNSWGFINTDLPLQVGQTVSFEDLKPYSYGGDLSIEHYQYFKNKEYRVTKNETGNIKLVEV